MRVGGLSDAQYQERKRNYMNRSEARLEGDLSRLMDTEWGRRIAHWLIFDKCDVQSYAMDMSIKDGLCSALHSARFDGRRAVGIDLHAEIQRVAPGQTITMLDEAMGEARELLAIEPKGQ